jgi:hypothetical protein
MKKIMPLMASVMLILVAGTFAGAGTMAIFRDTETVSIGDINAGTMDLTVDGVDPCVQHITIDNIAPGWSMLRYKWVLKNTGNIAGVVSVEFSAITNKDNLQTEPELIAEAESYGYQGARATLGDPDNGELGEYLKFGLLKADGYNYWGLGTDNSGPPAYGQIWGLNKLGGYTGLPGYTLGEGETCNIYLSLTLDSDLKAWDGCWTHDINDNVIQGDSVEFDIIFHLDQVTP